MTPVCSAMNAVPSGANAAATGCDTPPIARVSRKPVGTVDFAATGDPARRSPPSADAPVVDRLSEVASSAVAARATS